MSPTQTTTRRPIAETLRAVAADLDALPADLPEPSIHVYGHIPDAAEVSWHAADADQARRIVAALPGEWEAGSTYLTRRGDGPIRQWSIHLAKMQTVVADPAALVAERAS